MKEKNYNPDFYRRIQKLYRQAKAENSAPPNQYFNKC